VHYDRGVACYAGRRTIGHCVRRDGALAQDPRASWWSQIYQLEHEAVSAFVELAAQLSALDAPSDIIARCLRAAQEEVEHAQLTHAIACSYGARPEAPVHHLSGPRTLFEIALHNAVEGCVRETFAGVEALWQAAHIDASLRPALTKIARDECSHAELSWDLHRWALPQLNEAQRAQLQAAQRLAIDELRDALLRRDAHPALALPDPACALALLDATMTEVAL
jgi:hypothetical protein